MKWFNKALAIGALAITGLISTPKKAEACSGAIYLGRGGTNVSLAEGADAVYWNPSGLVQLQRPELDITVGDNLNYKTFICYAQPLDHKNAIGVNFSQRQETATTEKYWIKLAYSRKVNDRFSVGTNLTMNLDYEGGRLIQKELNVDPVYTDPVSINQYITSDIGLLYDHSDRIKFGLLLQSLVNLRPGISFKINDKTKLLLEGYDLLDQCENIDGESLRHYRSGLERTINDKFSLRVGASIKDFSEFWFLSAGTSYRNRNLEASVAALYWNDGEQSLVLSLNKKL